MVVHGRSKKERKFHVLCSHRKFMSTPGYLIGLANTATCSSHLREKSLGEVASFQS